MPKGQNLNKNLRVPPQNIDAEKALLGSIMLKPETIIDVSDIVFSKHFYLDKHQIIFDVMMSLHSNREPIDMLSVTTKLKEKKLLDEIGGPSFLADLVNFVPSASNAKHYAGIVQKKHMMRSLINAADQITQMGYEEDADLEIVMDEAEKTIFNITNSPTSSHKFVELKNILGEAWDRIESLHNNKGALRGVPSGFKKLDSILSGFQKSDLIILAARPSVGKTSLALDIVRNAAIRHDVSVGVFSLEMSAQQLVDRMLAAESKVDSWALRTGNLRADKEFSSIQEALTRLSKAPIYIDDMPGNNIIRMRSVARRLKSEKGLGLIVVDYLQLMAPVDSRKSDSMVQQITEVSRSLKNLARELNVPVIALSQLSREVEKRGGRPRLSDLRDSGSIEQDADIVAFIHREDKYKDDSDKPNIAEILIQKHRNGPVGVCELYFDEKRATFLDIDTHFGNFDEKSVQPEDGGF
jgi:replicative DNA helicase